MTNVIQIQPCGPVIAAIRPPGSKSITNRALVCASLANSPSALRGALDSDDTRIMVDCLLQLGVGIDEELDAGLLKIHGCGGHIPSDKAELFVGNSGTTIRFLTVVLALGNGAYLLDGVPRMRQRPIGDLVNALRQLGTTVSAASNDQFPPVRIAARGLRGGRTSIRGDASSQYLSGLLMAAPYATNDVTIDVTGPLVSRPYVEMTIRVMESFGASVVVDDDSFSIAANQTYRGCEYDIEPDASAASYFWAAAAVTGGRVTVDGLTRSSLQGDVRFCECLAQMGCTVNYGLSAITVSGPQYGALRGINVDMSDISDTVPTLAVLALFADGPTTIENVAHIRHKETDRIGDLARELRKLGANVLEREGGIVIDPQEFSPATIETYDDHRMAMSFAIAGLRHAGVHIVNPQCTSKTYPRFFDDLRSLCGDDRSPTSC
jgi:3-phosphoshikimate 1-carboxyvinyltransferase